MPDGTLSHSRLISQFALRNCAPESQRRLQVWVPRAGGRHVPGSQPPFSLIPDLDQNKEDTTFISVVAYGGYIPLSRPI